MSIFIDHYYVLGLPSGEAGAKLTQQEITKAYKSKALILHPDKRPHDPDAHSNFQLLNKSYHILRDEKARKLFNDDLLRRVKSEQQRRQSKPDGNNAELQTKLRADLDRREGEAFEVDRKRREEERTSSQFYEEIAEIKARFARKAAAWSTMKKKDVKKEKVASAPPAGGARFEERKRERGYLTEAEFQAKEAYVMGKLMKAAERQRSERQRGNCRGPRPTIPKNAHPKFVELLERSWQQDPTSR